MSAGNRVKGGEKNENSGKDWKREEIQKVFDLYIELNWKGIHETNPKIIQLGKKLNRTTRSVETQLIIFRSIERAGEYGHRNMNKLSKEIWFDYKKQELNTMPMNKPNFPQELFDWAGHKKGGVKKPFDETSGRPNGKVIETSLTRKINEWVNN